MDKKYKIYEKEVFIMAKKKEVNAFLAGLCVNHSGKMLGMVSYSTACTNNPYCIERAKNPTSICSQCYAQAQLGYQKNTDKKCVKNGDYIKNHVMVGDEVPTINAARFRFEAFGDLETVVQFANYVEVARKNPHCVFSLWTKNYFIVRNAVKLFPELWNEKKRCFAPNFLLIVSSPYVNKALDIAQYPMANKVFTVYSKEYLSSHPEVTINCGARNCLKCGRCYSKRTSPVVNELLRITKKSE